MVSALMLEKKIEERLRRIEYFLGLAPAPPEWVETSRVIRVRQKYGCSMKEAESRLVENFGEE